LSTLSPAFSSKKNDTHTDKNIFASFEFDFFRVQLKCAFRLRPLKSLKYMNITLLDGCVLRNDVFLRSGAQKKIGGAIFLLIVQNQETNSTRKPGFKRGMAHLGPSS